MGRSLIRQRDRAAVDLAFRLALQQHAHPARQPGDLGFLPRHDRGQVFGDPRQMRHRFFKAQGPLVLVHMLTIR